MKNIFLIKHSEPIPEDEDNVRLMRTGLLFNFLSIDHKVTWLTSRFDHFSKTHRDSGEYKLLNSTIVKIKSPGYKSNTSVKRIIDDFIYSFRTFIYLIKFCRNEDKIIISWPTIFPSFFCLIFSYFRSPKIYLEVRDLWPEVLLEEVRLPPSLHSLANKILRYLLSSIAKRSKKVIVPSNGYRDWMNQFVPIEKITISRFPYVPLEKEYSNFDMNKLNRLRKGRRLVVFFGTIGRMFDFDCLMNLSKEVRNDFYFAIFGSGDNLKAYKKQFNANDHIGFFGRIDGSDIAYISDVADFGFAPYKRVGNFRDHFPNKVVEYLSLSLPIIHTLSGEVTNLLDDQSSGIFYDGTSKSLESVLLSSEMEQLDRNKCKNLFLNKFTLESVGQDLIKVINE